MKNQIVSLAKELISIPSVSNDIPKAVEIFEVIKKQLPEYPYTSFVSRGLPSILYSNQTKKTKNFKIIFNAHMDVVPGTKEQYQPYIKDGRLYGRGALDTKAAGAVMILLFKEIAHKLSYPLALQLPADEETHGTGTGCQLEQGIRTEFAIMAECNSNFQVTNQSKGRKVVIIKTKGNVAHAAYPWHGQNAIEKMYRALQPLMEVYPIPTVETYETTVSITKIETENNALNRIPYDCTAYLDIRFAQKDEDIIVEKIRSLLPDDVSLESEHKHYYHHIDANNNYISLLRRATTSIIGKELPVRFTHATSDATLYSQVGCKAIEFGPIGEGAHNTNEWVDIQSLEDYYYILKNFLLQIEANAVTSAYLV